MTHTASLSDLVSDPLSLSVVSLSSPLCLSLSWYLCLHTFWSLTICFFLCLNLDLFLLLCLSVSLSLSLCLSSFCSITCRPLRPLPWLPFPSKEKPRLLVLPLRLTPTPAHSQQASPPTSFLPELLRSTHSAAFQTGQALALLSPGLCSGSSCFPLGAGPLTSSPRHRLRAIFTDHPV